MKNASKIAVLVAVVSMLLLAGCNARCNNASIPDEGKVMKDAEGNEYLVKFHLGNTYKIDPLPAKINFRRNDDKLHHD